MTNSVTIELPSSLYRRLAERAVARQQTPERYVLDVLQAQLSPEHPYIELILSRSGPRPVIKGTRIGVDVIAGYTQAGYTPPEIAGEILPQLTLAQVYDALSYYEDHRDVMDEMINTHTATYWQNRLRQEMGEAAGQLLGD